MHMSDDNQHQPEALYFPTRRIPNNNPNKISLACNYFKFQYMTRNFFYKYAIEFSPEIPQDSIKLRQKIFSKCRKALEEKIGANLFNNTSVYSKLEHADEFCQTSEWDEITYSIKFKLTNKVDPSSTEALTIHNIFFKSLLKKKLFIQIKKNYFDPKKAVVLQNYGIELWPGFNSSVNLINRDYLVNIDTIYKVLRADTALHVIQNMSKRNSQNVQSDIQEKFKGCTILTRYNNDKNYTISSVDFNKTPLDTFETKKGPVSFIEYYKNKYGKEIKEGNQPLLVSIDKKTKKEILLIPEFCFMTGLTDEMRENFNLMKEMSRITKGNKDDAANKVNECINLLMSMLDEPKCKEEIERWGLTIANRPKEINGHKLNVGNMLMANLRGGQRNSFSIEDNRDLDRKIQAEMFSQPNIRSISLIHSSKDEAAAKSFMENLILAKGSFNYPMEKPKVVRVDGYQFRDWERVLNNCELHKDDAVILIIPGSRGKGPLYSQLKKLLITNLPVPSQIILSGTITKGKNLRSIVNKILIQICTKIGGEPWAIDNMPCTNMPTMVCGMDYFSKKGKDTKSILGLTASYNRTFSKYFSVSKQSNSPTDKVLLPCMDEAIKNFGKINNIAPKHIIVLRDGVTPTQFGAVARDEVEQIKQVLMDNKLNDTKLTFVLLNKKTNVKIFQNNKSYQVPQPGTIVDTDLGECNKNEFYLVPQRTNQGLATPIYYTIAYDDKNIEDVEIQNLVYKLCYLYYNFVGGIKVPAPCQYAKKLAYLLGDKLSVGNDVPVPNKIFKDRIRSLYYL